MVPGPLCRVRPDTCGGPARSSSSPATGGHLRWEQSAAHHRRAQATSPVIMPSGPCTPSSCEHGDTFCDRDLDREPECPLPQLIEAILMTHQCISLAEVTTWLECVNIIPHLHHVLQDGHGLWLSGIAAECLPTSCKPSPVMPLSTSTNPLAAKCAGVTRNT